MLPDMPSDNPMSRLREMLEAAQRMLDEFASSVRTLGSATIDRGDLTIRGGGNVLMLDEDDALLTKFSRGRASFFDPATGGRTDLYKGRIYLWDSDGGDGDPALAGQVVVDQGAGRNYMRLFPPHESGTGLENSITIRGKSSTQTGMVWVYTDGVWQVVADVAAMVTAPAISLNTTASELAIYGLPTTSGGYLLRYNQVGGKWTMALDSSSRRYKKNIRDADIDPADVLKWRPRRWQDINQGDDAPWNTGLVAEEVDEAGTTEFVIYDEQDRPDGIRKEILAVGQQVVLQDHERRILELEAKDEERTQTIAALRDANQALALRLDALEAQRG